MIPFPLLITEKDMNTEKPKVGEKVRVGIVGLGRSGWNIHARLLGNVLDYFQVVAVHDPNQERMAEAKAKFGAKPCHTFRDLLKDQAVELAIIATPNPLHPQNTIDALKAGKAVVCEKPMAPTVAEADAMIATAKKTGSMLTIFQNYRYQPAYQKVKEIIDSGVLGRIVMIKFQWQSFSRRWDWQTLKKYNGGAINNTGPHAIDMALQLFGECDKPEVFCKMEKVLALGDAEDHVKLVIAAPGHPTLDIEITSACAYGQDPWLVMGSQGTLAGNNGNLRWKYFKPEEQTKRVLDDKPTPDRSYNADDLKFIEGSWTPEQYKGLGEDGYYLDVYRAIREKAPVAVTPESVRRVIWVLETCHKISPV